MLNIILQIISFLQKFVIASINFGLIQSFKYFFFPKKEINFLKIKNIKHKIFYRNFGDKGVISHLYNKNYKINDSKAKEKIRNIIDGGANIGIETIRFANFFPNAKIISVEANKSNYEMLKKNTENYENVIALYAALYNQEKKLYLSNPQKNKSDNFNESFFIDNNKINNSEEVNGITLSKILSENNIEMIDILKLDIEGAEKYLFDKTANAWIQKVQVLIFECSDIDVGASGVTQQIYNVISQNNIEFKSHLCGENLVLIKKESEYFLESTFPTFVYFY